MSYLTDFDKTITKSRFADGTKCDNSFKAILEYSGSPKDMHALSREDYKRYFPIYTDLSLPREERIRHMDDWWDCDMTRFA